jgi:dTDP-N-acetylfucosamine:lipid II N-acetylfucosaminyltransferase
MRNVHICENQKFTDSYIKLINKHFDRSEHLFLIIGKGIGAKITASTNVARISTKVGGGIRLLKEMYRSDKIHLHGLFIPQVVVLLFLQPWLLKKCNWIVWGGDLYSYCREKRKLKMKIKEMMRRVVIRYMGHITTLVRGDYDLAVEWYGTKGKYQHGVYVNPISLDYLNGLLTLNKAHTDTINIQVGNSGDPSNQHIEVLHSLKKFDKESIKIYIPLSYSGSKEYIDEIVKYGQEVFADKFVPMFEFLEPDEYAKYLSSIDVAIFNHDRQQALGNIFALLYLNKKVFIRSDITSWEYITKELGLDIFKFEEIDQLNFDAFYSNNSSKGNPQRVKKLFEDKHIAQVWNKIFEAEEK